MKHLARVLFATVLGLVVGATAVSAFAQDKVIREKDQVIYKKKTIVDFSDVSSALGGALSTQNIPGSIYWGGGYYNGSTGEQLTHETVGLDQVNVREKSFLDNIDATQKVLNQLHWRAVPTAGGQAAGISGDVPLEARPPRYLHDAPDLHTLALEAYGDAQGNATACWGSGQGYSPRASITHYASRLHHIDHPDDHDATGAHTYYHPDLHPYVSDYAGKASYTGSRSVGTYLLPSSVHQLRLVLSASGHHDLNTYFGAPESVDYLPEVTLTATGRLRGFSGEEPFRCDDPNDVGMTREVWDFPGGEGLFSFFTAGLTYTSLDEFPYHQRRGVIEIPTSPFLADSSDPSSIRWQGWHRSVTSNVASSPMRRS